MTAMNYGFAGVAYFGIFLSWFTMMYIIMKLTGGSLNIDNDEGLDFILTIVKIFALLTAISVVVGVVQFIIETINK